MTNEQLSASLSYLGDELLAECGARRQRPKRSWRTALIKAACIALVLFSGIYVAGRFDYSLARLRLQPRHDRGRPLLLPRPPQRRLVLRSRHGHERAGAQHLLVRWLRSERLRHLLPSGRNALCAGTRDGRADKALHRTAGLHAAFLLAARRPGASTSGSASTAIPFIRTKSQPTQSPMYRPGAIMTPSSGANTCSTAGPASCWRSGRSTHPPVRASSSSMKTRTSRSAGTNLPSCRAVSGGRGRPLPASPRRRGRDTRGDAVRSGLLRAPRRPIRSGRVCERREADTQYALPRCGRARSQRCACPNTRSYVAAADGFVFYDQYEWQLAEQRYVGVGCHDIATGEEWLLTVDRTDLTRELYDYTTDGVYLYACAPWSSAPHGLAAHL